jgi:hypothetical protein
MDKLKISLLLIIIFSCTNKLQQDSIHIKAIGDVKNASYTFCGFVPTEVDYSYRVGTWEFVTQNDIIIAKGEYNVTLETDKSSGGCEYTYFNSTIDIDKWEFWDTKRQKIKPSKRMINIINYHEAELTIYSD